MQNVCCKAKILCNIPLATLMVKSRQLVLPCLGIVSTFLLPVQSMGIDVPIPALIFP